MRVLKLNAGKYVLALSGGVDSVVLLDLLSAQRKFKLVLAHFNHGIRPDSYKDEELVQEVALRYKLVLEVGRGYLGPNTSEELARQKRYEFLRTIACKHGAQGIITAHHQDDLIETAFINILRGTSYRGLTAIYLNPSIQRPLIHIPKKEIISYAKSKQLRWNEDGSNQDTKYLRNYIRKYIMPKLSSDQRQQIVKIIEKVAKSQVDIEYELANLSQNIDGDNIDRQQFVNLPMQVSNELITFWLRQHNELNYDRKTVERLNIAIKTAVRGTKHKAGNNTWLKIEAKTAQLTKTT